MKLLLTWFVNAAALLLLPALLPGLQLQGLGHALLAALVIGLLNTLARPVLVLLTLPINVLTLGAFILVINGALFWLAARFVPSLSVDGLTTAMLAAIAYSVLSWAGRTLVVWPLFPGKSSELAVGR